MTKTIVITIETTSTKTNAFPHQEFASLIVRSKADIDGITSFEVIERVGFNSERSAEMKPLASE